MKSLTLSLIRLTLLAMFTLAIGTMGRVALAQDDVLPVPDAGVRAVTPEIITPAAGTHVNRHSVLTWNRVGAMTYDVKIKDLTTGQTYKSFAGIENNICNAMTCQYSLYDAGMLDDLVDGRQYKWKVIAYVKVGQYGSEAVKGGARTFYADRVNTPQLVNIADGATIGYADNLTWIHHPANVSYVLYVKDKSNGATVLQMSVDGSHCAGSLCSINFHAYRPLQNQPAQMKWFVKAFGINATAKSQSRTFVNPY
ncbi:MAG: hypothetical protein IPM16_20265 [Chloroflexi bacterium]|nr:hypothetical protein [Chloroflexota bacterium]